MDKEYPAGKTRQPGKNLTEFATYIASHTAARITGVFLERHQGQLIPVMRNIHKMPAKEKDLGISPNIAGICCGKCKDNEYLFNQTCNSKQGFQNMGPGRVAAIIKTSRFSDLLILEAEMSIDKDNTGMLSGLSSAVLTKSECPVMIAPYAFEDIQEIIFAYDGSVSAAFAIKQFTYLFPMLGNKKLEVLQVIGREEAPVKDCNKLLSLLQMHYTTIDLKTLQGIASEELFNYLARRKNAMVIMGAFGTHMPAMPSRQSTAAALIKTINLPLFTAHHQ